jgi:hypothetical protein
VLAAQSRRRPRFDGDDFTRDLQQFFGGRRQLAEPLSLVAGERPAADEPRQVA